MEYFCSEGWLNSLSLILNEYYDCFLDNHDNYQYLPVTQYGVQNLMDFLNENGIYEKFKNIILKENSDMMVVVANILKLFLRVFELKSSGYKILKDRHFKKLEWIFKFEWAVSCFALFCK